MEVIMALQFSVDALDAANNTANQISKTPNNKMLEIDDDWPINTDSTGGDASTFTEIRWEALGKGAANMKIVDSAGTQVAKITHAPSAKEFGFSGGTMKLTPIVGVSKITNQASPVALEVDLDSTKGPYTISYNYHGHFDSLKSTVTCHDFAFGGEQTQSLTYEGNGFLNIDLRMDVDTV